MGLAPGGQGSPPLPVHPWAGVGVSAERVPALGTAGREGWGTGALTVQKASPVAFDGAGMGAGGDNTRHRTRRATDGQGRPQ